MKHMYRFILTVLTIMVCLVNIASAETYNEILGTQIIGINCHIVTFSYDISRYSNVEKVYLIVYIGKLNYDPYLRYTIIGIITPEGFKPVKNVMTITNSFRWPDPVPNEYKDKFTAYIVNSGTVKYDITNIVQKYRTGTIVVGADSSKTSYRVEVRLRIITKDSSDTTPSPTTTSEPTATPTVPSNTPSTSSPESTRSNGSTVSSEQHKYALLGILVIVIIVIVFLLGRKKRGVYAVVVLIVLSGIFATEVLAYDATPTGYYLPRGYKVKAKARFPGCGFWPGDYVGDIVGVSTSGYEVLVVGKCEKAWNGGVWDCFKVYWIEGGQQKEVANIHSTPEEDHTIVIVYGYDGMVKISIDGQLAYSFVGTTDKYSIVAQGAKVSAPEPLPEDGSDSGTGEGYNPPSVSELQVQYLLLGAGATAIAVPVIYMFVKKKR